MPVTRIQLELPDDLTVKAKKRASESGHASLEQYLQSLVRADADAPEHLTFKDDAQLESLLHHGIDSGPSAEITAAQWEQRRQDLIARHSHRNTP
jgi:hypothetical protein